MGQISPLLKLLTWLSPSFPVGAFSYSHGLEWAVEDGTIRTAADLTAWIGDILRHGGGRTDAILFAHGWRAAHDPAAIAELVVLAAAFQPSRERQLETLAQGRAFLTTIARAWANPDLDAALAALPPDEPVAYPLAVAITAACHAVPLEDALPAYLHAFASNLVSAGLRAVPLGQTDGQQTIATLGPIIEAVATEALTAGLEELGGATLRADIASMRHETQYTRLFRS